MKLTVFIPVIAVICLAGQAAGQHVTKPAPKPPAVRPQRTEWPPQNEPPAARPGAAAARDVGPGSVENLIKLLKLSPEQRNKALSSLPPARRAQMEKRLNDLQKMPAPERARSLEHLRRMQSLPPHKQQQVRASVQKLTTLPEPRRKLVNRQINQLRSLSDADRRAMMNTEEFRSKFTPSEQQMIEDICLVTPQS